MLEPLLCLTLIFAEALADVHAGYFCGLFGLDFASRLSPFLDIGYPMDCLPVCGLLLV